MNKNKLFKLIDELKGNIEKDLENHPRCKLYVKTWVIGGLHMLEAKAKGETYYPHNATYKSLFEDFKEHYLCQRIVEEIKFETLSMLIKKENYDLVIALQDLIK